MKWVLIAIVLSNWDAIPIKHEAIARYENLEQCQSNADILNQRTKYAKYVCANATDGDEYIALNKKD